MIVPVTVCHAFLRDQPARIRYARSDLKQIERTVQGSNRRDGGRLQLR